MKRFVSRPLGKLPITIYEGNERMNFLFNIKKLFFIVILFQFFTTIVYGEDPAFIAGKKCQQSALFPCQKEVDSKFKGNSNAPGYGQALQACGFSYEACMRREGMIKQNTGGYVMMYHPDNPKFVECKKKLGSDVLSGDPRFIACMNAQPVAAKPPQSQPAQTSSRAPTETAQPPKDTASLEQQCKSKGEAYTLSPDKQYCYCASGYADLSNDIKNPNCVKIGGNTASQPVTVREVAMPTRSNQIPEELYSCLKPLRDSVERCKKDADESANFCNLKSEEAKKESLFGGSMNMNDMEKTLQIAEKGYLASKAGSGAYDMCLKAGLISNTTIFAAKQLSDKCSDRIESCTLTCKNARSLIEDYETSVKAQCARTLGQMLYEKNKSLGLSDSEIEALLCLREEVALDKSFGPQLFAEVKELSITTENATAKCDEDASQLNKNNQKALADMNNSAKDANYCRCTVSANRKDCEQAKRVGPLECQLNPNYAGCTNLTALNCFNNSDPQYKSMCACMTNPNSKECLEGRNKVPEVEGLGTSQFPGPGANGLPYAGVNTTNSSGPSGLSSADLSGLNDVAQKARATSGTTDVSGSSPFGGISGISSNVGGSGAPSGSGEGGEEGAATADEGGTVGRGIKSFFNTAKSSLMNAFGGERNSAQTNSDRAAYKYDAQGNRLNPDGTRWRPKNSSMVRGLANNDENEFGSRSMDIWKMMNKQYGLQMHKDRFIEGNGDE